MVKRQTAIKIEIGDIIKGNYTEEGLILLNGQKIVRARILGTIVAKFFAEERTYGFIVIDDSTETIRVKAYKEQAVMIENLRVGDIVEVFGRIKEWEDEVYIVPEQVVLIDDPNWEVLRKFELAKEKKMNPSLTTGQNEQDKKTKAAESKSNEVCIDNEIIEEVIENPRQKITELIEKLDKGEGALITELVKEFGDEKTVENVLTELMNEGEIFEPRPGKVKILS